MQKAPLGAWRGQPKRKLTTFIDSMSTDPFLTNNRTTEPLEEVKEFLLIGLFQSFTKLSTCVLHVCFMCAHELYKHSICTQVAHK